MAKRVLPASNVLPFSVVRTIGVAGSPSVFGIIRKGGPAPLWLQCTYDPEAPGHAYKLAPNALVKIICGPLALAQGFMGARYPDQWAKEPKK